MSHYHELHFNLSPGQRKTLQKAVAEQKPVKINISPDQVNTGPYSLLLTGRQMTDMGNKLKKGAGVQFLLSAPQVKAMRKKNYTGGFAFLAPLLAAAAPVISGLASKVGKWMSGNGVDEKPIVTGGCACGGCACGSGPFLAGETRGTGPILAGATGHGVKTVKGGKKAKTKADVLIEYATAAKPTPDVAMQIMGENTIPNLKYVHDPRLPSVADPSMSTYLQKRKQLLKSGPVGGDYVMGTGSRKKKGGDYRGGNAVYLIDQ